MIRFRLLDVSIPFVFTGSVIITTFGVNVVVWAWRMMQVIPALGREG